ncbi:MAG: hypothetical protein QM820_20475 [Minicystis sp.]
MEEANPYAPPKADTAPAEPAAEGAAPAYKLYTPGQIFLATFLGTPIAGMYLLSANRRRLGHASLATMTLIGGLALGAVLLVLASVVPAGGARSLSLGITIAVGYYARTDQPLLDAHLAKGGRKESTWKAAGIGVAALVAFMAVFVAVMAINGELD